VIQGSPTTSADNLPVARMFDITQNTCPYSQVGVIISSSSITSADTLGIARLSVDIVQFTYGTATFIIGSPITSVD